MKVLEILCSYIELHNNQLKKIDFIFKTIFLCLGMFLIVNSNIYVKSLGTYMILLEVLLSPIFPFTSLTFNSIFIIILIGNALYLMLSSPLSN